MVSRGGQITEVRLRRISHEVCEVGGDEHLYLLVPPLLRALRRAHLVPREGGAEAGELDHVDNVLHFALKSSLASAMMEIRTVKC